MNGQTAEALLESRPGTAPNAPGPVKHEAMSVRAGIIGYGGAFNMGRLHADWMRKAGIDVRAVCDSDPARREAAVSENPGVATFGDYRELLSMPDIDLAVIILPHNLHSDVSVAASQAGKHVVVEKPMCLSRAEADAMIGAADATGKMLSVFQNRRWDGDFMTVRDLIHEGLIGDVVAMELAVGGFDRPSDWWRSRKTISGGILFDWGAHMVDWILQIMSTEPVGVSGSLYSGAWGRSQDQIEDHGEVCIRFKTGATASAMVTTLGSVPKPRWRVFGSKGGLILPGWGDPITVKVDHQGRMATFDVKPKPDAWGSYYENIFAHLTDGAELICKATESRRVISILEAAEKSAGSGQMASPF